jgi:hypothetical protein
MAAVGSRKGVLPALNAEDALGVQMLAYQIDGRHEQAGGPRPPSSERLERHPPLPPSWSSLSPCCRPAAPWARILCPVLKTRRCACTRVRRARSSHGRGLADRDAAYPVPGRRAVVAQPPRPNCCSSRSTRARATTTASRTDYAISAERFHWQSQNSAGPDTPGGRRYLESATTAGSSSCS